MSNQTLLLGSVQFADFELPTSITWGGAQSLAVHRLPGGVRVIDAMGRDDAALSWSGIFTGPDAATRAQALDLMRADGAVLPLAWQGFSYSAVIAKFEADYRRSNWIAYRIECTVLRDEAASLSNLALSAAQEAAQDLATAAGFSNSLAQTPIDIFASGPVDLSLAGGLAGSAATQAAASFYLARAAQNLVLG